MLLTNNRAKSIRLSYLGEPAAAVEAFERPNGLRGEGTGEKRDAIQSVARPFVSSASASPPGELSANMVCSISRRLSVQGSDKTGLNGM